MTLEVALLILETVLLVFTVVLLLFNIKEGRGRRGLLIEVERATKILTRQEYFLTVADSMGGAKKDVMAFITGRLPTGEDRKMTEAIAERISKLSASGVTVRYLLPRFHDRLYVGSLYRRAGAEVRFSGRPTVNDIRYTIVDRKATVLGIPERTGEKEATKKGFRIPSEGLALILQEYFFGCWEVGDSYEDYARAVLKQTGMPPKLLAEELGLDAAEIEEIAGAAKK